MLLKVHKVFNSFDRRPFGKSKNQQFLGPGDFSFTAKVQTVLRLTASFFSDFEITLTAAQLSTNHIACHFFRILPSFDEYLALYSQDLCLM